MSRHVRFWDSGTEVRMDGASTDDGYSLSSEGALVQLGSAGAGSGWTGKVLVVTFPVPTAVTDFAFQTHAEHSRDWDPIRFSFEGSADGMKWLVLCDETMSRPLPKLFLAG